MKRSEIGVIPVPKRINTTGKTVEINPCISCNTPEWKNMIDVTQKAFEKIFNVALEDGNGGIRIVFDKNADENAYCIKVENGIILSAGGIEGCDFFELAREVVLLHGVESAGGLYVEITWLHILRG